VTPDEPIGEQDATVGAELRAVPLGDAAPVEPVDVPTRTVVLVGTAVWVIALVVTLLVPGLHTGSRSWWPWTCVTGIVLGLFAWWYVGRSGRETAGR
jgi:hypothetical protein